MIQKAVKSLIRIGMSNILNVKIICLVWFCCLEKCNSLREVAGGMLGLSGKEETVSQSSSKRALCRTQTNVEKWSFEEIYNNLLKKYSFILSDSRIQIALGKNIKIVDSTTISLFKDILKCVGRKAINGKAKAESSHIVL
jgi:hypothetical protein